MVHAITDERSANEALKTVVAGNKVRITFKSDVGDKFQQTIFLQFRHKLEFDTMWLAVAHNTLAMYGEWREVPRTQDFTVTRMSGADREVFANILVGIAESVEVL